MTGMFDSGLILRLARRFETRNAVVAKSMQKQAVSPDLRAGFLRQDILRNAGLRDGLAGHVNFQGAAKPPGGDPPAAMLMLKL